MKSLYAKVDGIFGYRQMMLNMNRKFGQNFNHKRIYRLMKIAGLQSVIRKRKNVINLLPHNMSQKMY